MEGTNSPQVLLRARVAIDQVMLSRLATQSAIERSRGSLAETRRLLVALRFAVDRRPHTLKIPIRSSAAVEAQRLMAALTKIHMTTNT
jgi:hypothetical protein